jgi:hypothetical protein
MIDRPWWEWWKYEPKAPEPGEELSPLVQFAKTIEAKNYDPEVETGSWAWGDTGTIAGHALDTEKVARTGDDGGGNVSAFLRVKLYQGQGNADQNLTRTYKLQQNHYDADGGGLQGWTDVGSVTSAVVYVADSTPTDGDSVGERLTEISTQWLSGEYDEGDGTLDSITWTADPVANDEETEVLWSLVFNDTVLEDGDYVDFRVYDVTGSVAIANSGGVSDPRYNWVLAVAVDQADFRIRAPVNHVDEIGPGLNVDTGWAAAKNADYTGDVWERVFRVRFGVENSGGSAGAKQFEPWWRYDTGGGYSAWAVLSNPSTVEVVYGQWDGAIEQFGLCIHQSSTFANGAITTTPGLLGGTGTWVNGEGRESEPTGSITLNTNERTEIEFAFLLRKISNSFAFNDGLKIQIQLRYSDGTELDSYTNTPTITLDSTQGIVGGCRVESPHRDFAVCGESYYALTEYCDETGTYTYENYPLMHKSVDGGVTWEALDIGDGPGFDTTNFQDLEGADMVWDKANNKLLILGHGNEARAAGRIGYMEFDTSTDTWVVVDSPSHYEHPTDDTLLHTLTGTYAFLKDAQSCAIELRSSGGIWAAWTDCISNGGTETRVSIAKRTSGGTWDATKTDVDSESGAQFTCGPMVRDSTGRIHLFYFDLANGYVWHRSISTADSLSGRSEVCSTVDFTMYTGTGGISRSLPITTAKVYWDGGTEKVAVIVGGSAQSGGALYYIESPVGSISFSTPQLLTDGSTSTADWSQGDSYQIVADLAIDTVHNNLVYARWGGPYDPDPSASDLYGDIRTDGSWGTDGIKKSTLGNSSLVNWVRSEFCIRDGRYRLATFYDVSPSNASDGTTGTPVFMEEDLGPIEIPMPLTYRPTVFVPGPARAV